MYFNSRKQAGEILLARMVHMGGIYENLKILCLNEKSQEIAQPIAEYFKADTKRFLTASIKLPREPDTFAVIDQRGEIHYDDKLPESTLNEMLGEYHNYIDQKRIEAVHRLNMRSKNEDIIDAKDMKHSTVLTVTDAATSGLNYKVIYEFLKPIDTKKIIAASPIATVKAVDKMHIYSDEIQVLSVTDNFISADHYYEG